MRTSRCVCLLGVLAIGGAGCAHKAPPLGATTVPAAWTSPVDASAPVWPDPIWWKGFNSAELDSLIAEAQANNLDLGAAAARIDQARAQKRIAFAPLLPSFDGGASAQKFGGDGRGSTFSTGTFGGTARDQSYSLDVSAGYELDFWGKNRAGFSAAKAALRESRFDQGVVALTVTSGTANTYLQVLSLRERLAIAGANLDIAERVLRVVDSRVRNGAATPLDLAQQRGAVAQQKAQIPALAQQELAARAALALLLGRAPEGFDVADQTLDSIAAPTVAPGLPSELLARRPDIRRDEAALQGADANIHAARAAFFPSISLTGSAGLESVALSGLFGGAGLATSVAASLVQPIFEGGRLIGQLDFSVARRQELVSTYRTTVLTAFSDVEIALAAIGNTAAQEALGMEQVTQAQRALTIAESQYREGATDLLSLLDAQRTLYAARDGLSQTRLLRLQAVVSLFKALGGGWSDAPTVAAAKE